jgi:hypothetical protein
LVPEDDKNSSYIIKGEYEYNIAELPDPEEYNKYSDYIASRFPPEHLAGKDQFVGLEPTSEVSDLSGFMDRRKMKEEGEGDTTTFDPNKLSELDIDKYLITDEEEYNKFARNKSVKETFDAIDNDMMDGDASFWGVNEEEQVETPPIDTKTL